MELILQCDGAAKGNPGPAGIGVVLYQNNENEPLVALGEFIGNATNNVAEYKALVRGLSEALGRGADTIEVRTDSELMARQVQGRYKVNSPQLAPLHAEATALLGRFASAKIVHVLRGKNALADKLANQGVAAGEAPVLSEPTFRHTYATTTATERLVYNVERLWELAKELPVRAVPLAQVAGVLDENCWFGNTAPTLRRVAEHARRIYEADFGRPILLNAAGELMDGAHRVARAFLENKAEIDAVQFPTDPEPDFRRPRSQAR